ncbi:MAG: helicase-related protein [Myxococcota bacterium]
MSTSSSLPIEHVRGDVERALGRAEPIVVAAPTGSGKSTQLPGWLAEAGPVLVVEPRRVACRALASWVAKLHGETLGEDVGYRVRFDDRTTAETRIVFATPGIALNLLASGEAERFATIMVDEFHERSWEIDLLVMLVRRARAAGGGPRLLLCSATLDTDALVEALAAQRIEAEGRRFPVTVAYRGEATPSPRDLEPRVAAAVEHAIGNWPEGDVLVFLPGKGEIERCGRALARLPVTCCPVHGGLPPAALMRAFAEAPGRRVFLSTNVAETSLTLPGVRVVIDSGLVRRRQHQAGRSVLALLPISRASMEQRAGRAGRVAEGHCIRLWGEGFAADAVTPPEIARVELDDMVLRASQCGISAGELHEAPWVESPPPFALEAAIERLRAAATLDGQGRLTAVGRARAKLPVSTMSARILVDPPSALAGTIADLVALMELSRDLVLPGMQSESVQLARRELFGKAVDEVEVQRLALRAGKARAHGLHPAALEEARKLTRALRAAVGAKSRADEKELDRDALVQHLLERVPEAAFVPRARASKVKGKPRPGKGKGPSAVPWGNGRLEVLVRPTWVPGLEADEQPSAAEAGVLLDLEWLGHGRSAQGRGRMLLRCRLRQLHAAGLGDTTFGPPILDRKGRRTEVVADQERTYAGVCLHRERAPLTGAALCEGIATLLLDGRVIKGLGERVRDDLHLWGLIEQDGEGEPQPVPEPLEFLRERLQTLGLSSFEELSLLEPDDLCPDVEARATARGIFGRALQSLREDFPRIFAYESTVYHCRVELRARRVTLHVQRAKGKGSEPPVRVLPRFRGFAVEYQKASRRLRLR